MRRTRTLDRRRKRGCGLYLLRGVKMDMGMGMAMTAWRKGLMAWRKELNLSCQALHPGVSLTPHDY